MLPRSQSVQALVRQVLKFSKRVFEIRLDAAPEDSRVHDVCSFLRRVKSSGLAAEGVCLCVWEVQVRFRLTLRPAGSYLTRSADATEKPSKIARQTGGQNKATYR